MKVLHALLPASLCLGLFSFGLAVAQSQVDEAPPTEIDGAIEAEETDLPQQPTDIDEETAVDPPAAVDEPAEAEPTSELQPPIEPVGPPVESAPSEPAAEETVPAEPLQPTEPPSDARPAVERPLPDFDDALAVRNYNDRIQTTLGLEGAVILDARLVDDDQTGPTLIVGGKLRDEGQREQIIELVRSQLENDPDWYDVDVDFNTDGLVLVAPSSTLGNRYFSMALHYFWDGEFGRADRAFALAIGEQPQIVVYRYWSVLTALAQHDRLRAKAKLRALLADDPMGSSNPQIAIPLERVQGWLRWELLNLEKEILLEGISPVVPTEPRAV